MFLVMFASLPALANGIYEGHDTLFHILRIEGLKEAMLSGQFPPKQHPLQLYGYGYATGEMYPQLFIYPSAFLRILGFDRVTAHRALIILVNLLTVGISYYSFNRIFAERSIALAGTVLYTLAPYRIMDMYFRDAAGEYCAMIGLPLVVWGLYSFVAEERREKEPAYVALALGYSFAAESHILTVIFLGVYSILFGLIFIKRFIKADRLVCLVKAIVLTVLINLGFLIPFLDYIRLPMNKFNDSIAGNGIDIVQVFTNGLLQDPQKLYNIETLRESGNVAINDEMPYAIGYAILFTTAAFILFAGKEKKNRRLGACAAVFGAVNVILSLYIFPWKTIEEMVGTKIISNIQFPWRFLMYATIAFVISGCVGMQYLYMRVPRNVILAAVFAIAVFGYTNMTDFIVEKSPLMTGTDVNPMYLGSDNEYLLEGIDPEFVRIRGGLSLYLQSRLN